MSCETGLFIFIFDTTKQQTMQNKFQLKMLLLSKVTIILFISALICFSACRQKPGDPQMFSELTYEQLTEKNVPKGLKLRNGEVHLDDGYEIIHSADSTMAMIIRPGSPGGETAMRCECDGLVKLGCIVLSNPIFTCQPIL